MQAIITKFLPYTNTKPSRVKATCCSRSVTIPYNDGGLDSQQAHVNAAWALIDEMAIQGNWSKDVTLVSGGLPSNDGYAFVMLPNK